MGYYPSGKEETDRDVKEILKEVGIDLGEPLWTCCECYKRHREQRCPRCGCPNSI